MMLDDAITAAVQVARQAGYKYQKDGLPYPKECSSINESAAAIDTTGTQLSQCKRTKNTKLLDLKIPLEKLANILRREEEFRLSPQVQVLYDEFKHPPPCIEGELQTRALEEHGLCRCYLNRYWRTSQYVDKAKHPDVWNSVVYLRYFDRYLEDWQVPCKNRNQEIPSIPLIPTEDVFGNKPVDLLSQYHTNGRPLVVVSGSQS
jgi:hypothetical protein